VAHRVYEAVGSLLQFPHLGRSGRKRGTRELVLSGLPFLAIYRVWQSAIEIARILHGARRWPQPEVCFHSLFEHKGFELTAEC
jgi:toxin ParE1/3/4